MAFDPERLELARTVEAMRQTNPKLTYEDVANALDKSHLVVMNAVKDLRIHRQRTVTTPFAITHRGDRVRLTLPRYDYRQHFEGDWIVCGDIHLPTTNWHLMKSMIALGQAVNVKRLMIVGDLINGDALSRHGHEHEHIPLSVEIATAKETLKQLLTKFEEIVLLGGNHDYWFARHWDGVLGLSELWELIVQGDERVKAYTDTAAWIHSGGEKWRVTHQRTYSRNKLKVADDLSNKYDACVILHHQHHMGITRDKNNRHTIVDNGGLHDDALIYYANAYDSNMPVMNSGFTLLSRGVAHLFTPYKSMTNWHIWGVDDAITDALFEYEARKVAIRTGALNPLADTA